MNALLNMELVDYLSEEIIRMRMYVGGDSSDMAEVIIRDMPEDMFKAMQESISCAHRYINIAGYDLWIMDRRDLVRLLERAIRNRARRRFNFWRI